MRKMLAAFLFVAQLLLLAKAMAADAPETAPATAKIQARFESSADATVGMPARLIVDVWTTTWFLKAPELPALEIQGAVASLSDGTQHLNDAVAGQSWFGIEFVYLITPTAGGTLDIPAFTVVVHPGPGGKPVSLQTKPLQLVAKALPAAAAQGASLITTRLQLHEQFDRDLKSLKTGNSITRTISMTAAGTPAMLLPPIEFAPIEGLAVYTAPAQVANTSEDRGEFTGGRRVDAATYVIQKAGDYTLPAVEVHWWNPQTQTLQTEKLAAVHFNAAAGPAQKNEFDIPDENLVQHALRTNRHLPAIAIVAALLLFSLYRWLKPTFVNASTRMRGRYAQARQRYLGSERYAYKQLLAALDGKDLAKIYRMLDHWGAHLPVPATGPQALAARCSDTQLTQAICELELALFAGVASNADIPGRLHTHITAARRKLLASPASTGHRLADLNPA